MLIIIITIITVITVTVIAAKTAMNYGGNIKKMLKKYYCLRLH